MKQKLLMTTALLATSLQAADDLSSMFKEGKTSGQIRAFHLDRAYHGFPSAVHRNGTSLGGHLKFETAKLHGFSVGTAFYTANRVLRSEERSVIEPALFANKGSGSEPLSQTIIGEAYLDYQAGKTNIKAGRQKINTPLAGSDDVRTIANFFEGAMLTNKSLENTTFTLGQLTAFSAGTFANIYDSDSILGPTSGYSPLAVSYDNQGDFQNIGMWLTGTNTSGVTVASATYENKGMKLQVWDYVVSDIVNAAFVQADMNYGAKEGLKSSIGIQAIKEDSIGDALIKNLPTSVDGEIDSLYWGVKTGLSYGSFSASVAYSETGANSEADKTNNPYKNSIITIGNIPAYTQGMVTRHMFMAGTKATKSVLAYKTTDIGEKFSTSVYYTDFQMDANNGYTTDATASEYGFDMQYYPKGMKELQLRFRGNFPRLFKDIPGTGVVNWDEYRLIANYTF